MQPSPSVLTLARQISLLVLDCDGVLTDGRLYYLGERDGAMDEGLFALAFYAQDGHALKMLMQSGIEVAVISGRSSAALDHRMKELGITHVYSKVAHKGRILKDLMDTLKLEQRQVATMGDDIPDLALFRIGGLSIAPSDSHPMVRGQADYVTKALGGRGAVREAVQLIMSAQDSFEPMIEQFLKE